MCGWFGASCGTFEWRGQQQKADFILSNGVLVFVCLFFFPMHPFRNDASGCEGDDDSNKQWKRQFPHVNVCVPRPPLMHALTLSPFYR